MKTDHQFKNRALIERCRQGNRKAQFELFKLYADAMYNVGVRFLGSKEDAEDIVQEAFVDAFRKLDGFKFESSYGSWLKRIVINKCINHLKAKKINLVPLEDQQIEHMQISSIQETHVEPVQELERVRIGISRLPDGYKHIITLYLIEGYDHTEIAEILDVSVSTSKSQYHRAKKKLLAIMDQL